MQKPAEIFKGVYRLGNKLLTKNLVLGSKTYGEELLNFEGIEYRDWDPYRSKLAAALNKGLSEFPIKEGSNILYLGSAEGTTISHISDIIGGYGAIFGVDISAKVMQKFLYICESRKNIVPILADAAQPMEYKENLSGFAVDFLYQDVSQREQALIFLKNARAYLKSGSYGMLAIKARSINATESVKEIVKKEIAKLYKEFDIIQRLDLEPYDKEHAMVLCRRK